MAGLGRAVRVVGPRVRRNISQCLISLFVPEHPPPPYPSANSRRPCRNCSRPDRGGRKRYGHQSEHAGHGDEEQLRARDIAVGHCLTVAERHCRFRTMQRAWADQRVCHRPSSVRLSDESTIERGSCHRWEEAWRRRMRRLPRLLRPHPVRRSMTPATPPHASRLIRLFREGVEPWPFWEITPGAGPDQPTAAELGLSDVLSNAVSAWVEHWRYHFWSDLKWDNSRQRADFIEWGNRLRERVSAELGPHVEVVLVDGGF